MNGTKRTVSVVRVVHTIRRLFGIGACILALFQQWEWVIALLLLGILILLSLLIETVYWKGR